MQITVNGLMVRFASGVFEFSLIKLTEEENVILPIYLNELKAYGNTILTLYNANLKLKHSTNIYSPKRLEYISTKRRCSVLFFGL